MKSNWYKLAYEDENLPEPAQPSNKSVQQRKTPEQVANHIMNLPTDNAQEVTQQLLYLAAGMPDEEDIKKYYTGWTTTDFANVIHELEKFGVLEKLTYNEYPSLESFIYKQQLKSQFRKWKGQTIGEIPFNTILTNEQIEQMKNKAQELGLEWEDVGATGPLPDGTFRSNWN